MLALFLDPPLNSTCTWTAPSVFSVETIQIQPVFSVEMNQFNFY